jgi:hypothetical protein
LPSSLTRVLPIALVFSTRLPVSDCGTVTIDLARHFSCKLGSPESPHTQLSFASRRWMGRRICLSSPPTGLDAHSQKCARITVLGHALALTWVQLTASTQLSLGQPRIASARRHLAVQTIFGGSGISTGCPSPTTFVLGLGPTNPERTSLPQETLGFRRVGFSPTLRYSCRHSHSRPLQPSSRSTFAANRTLPYRPPAHGRRTRSFGTKLEPRWIFGAEPLDQ